MKNQAGVSDSPIEIGRTEVVVFRKDTEYQNGKPVEVTKQIHKGVVVEATTHFVRVFDYSKNSSDSTPETAEMFPLHGGRCWCVIMATRQRYQAFFIPPSLRR